MFDFLRVLISVFICSSFVLEIVTVVIIFIICADIYIFFGR